MIARAESIKQQVLDHPTSEQLTESLWRELKQVLDRQVDAAEQGAPGGLERGLTALAGAVLEDQALLAKLDDWIIGAVLRIVEQHRHEVGQLIAHTVSAWDPDETSRRIELQVGRDLQFVRINGTLVGGLVGLMLYTLTSVGEVREGRRGGGAWGRASAGGRETRVSPSLRGMTLATLEIRRRLLRSAVTPHSSAGPTRPTAPPAPPATSPSRRARAHSASPAGRRE